jgi:hypothetical protein
VGWVVLGVWIGVVVVAALVLASCAYELTWKSRRLRSDLRGLAGLSEMLTALQADVQAAQRRLGVASRAVSPHEER